MAVDVGTVVASAGLQARYVPVSEIATTPLQQGGFAIIFLVTSLAFTIWGIRMYSRFSAKQLGIVFKYEYIGFPTSQLPDTYDLEPVLFWNWIMQVLYNPILALVKSSVLVFLLRLGGHRRSIRWSIYALNTFNIALGTAIFFTVLFQTIPINAFWNASVTKKHQIDGPMFYISTAVITIVTDFLVLLIPFWVFLGLKMRLAAKLGLILVFLMGGVVTVVAIIRVHELRKKFYHLGKGYDSRNTLGDTLSSIEINLAIMACCGPALRPLFRRMFPSLFSNQGSSVVENYNTPSKYGDSTGLRRAAGNGSFPLKEIHMSKTHTEIRGHSPNGSEEEIMTYNGIIRTTNVHIEYDQAPWSERASGREHSQPVDNSVN
ncbi:hypothetical protein FZEAL_7486 [Fusarium zealandicum]|uniref:Rhodopsin domain-containing protein n=1 Tax=Fusarium zealandicum TaxID=1053134 RepID=A0A8H4XIL3_9HYPO|nr:hypothetical protein FZEAL_7486 [Fusarium zealandicum]